MFVKAVEVSTEIINLALRLDKGFEPDQPSLLVFEQNSPINRRPKTGLI
jgi:hypothetical protein